MKYCRLSPTNYEIFKTFKTDRIFVDVGIHPILIRHDNLGVWFGAIDDVYSVTVVRNNPNIPLMTQEEIIHQ
jgi:hypothetical protein